MAETSDERPEPDRAKGIQHIPPARPGGTPRQKPVTAAQKRAVAEDKARRAKRRRAGKDRYE